MVAGSSLATVGLLLCLNASMNTDSCLSETKDSTPLQAASIKHMDTHTHPLTHDLLSYLLGGTVMPQVRWEFACSQFLQQSKQNVTRLIKDAELSRTYAAPYSAMGFGK